MHKILFIVTQSEMGGAQHFLYEIISKLSKEKYEIKVAVGNTGEGEFADKLWEIGIKISTLEFLAREIDPIADIRAVFEIRDLIKEFKPDTLFLNSSKAGFIGSLATTLLRYHTNHPRVIYRIGGWTFNDPWPAWKKNIWILLEKKSAKWKDIIIVNNKHDLDQAKELKIRPKEKIVLIHNGLDIYKIDFIPREEARLKLFERAAKYSGRVFQTNFMIGTIANFYPPKGLEIFIQSAEYFKNNDSIGFFIIGDGKDRPKLETLIKEKLLDKKVFLLGRIPDAKQYLQAFDLFVLPSLKEGFPWALIEAMAAKLPVIATKVGAVPEIIENGKNGFIVEPGKPEQIAKRIKEIANNDRLATELSIQAHQTVLFKFSEDKMLKQIEELL